MSDDVGDLGGTRTRPSKGSPCCHESEEGNMSEAKTSDSMSVAKTAGNMESVSPGLLRVMERAKRNPQERQLSLAYLIDVEALRRSYQRTSGRAAVGVDGIDKKGYGQNLEENLRDLHKRLKEMKYRHQPILRVHIPKENGTRPIGISTVEDKIVQGALSEILGAIYEQEFLECSYGFRPKRGPHDALRDLNQAVRNGEVNMVLEADIKSFFDTIVRKMLVEMLQERIADKSFMRLIGKCLHVGVLEGEEFSSPDEGTVQGSIISPILGNIYLHYALDKWFETEVKPRLKGKAILIRYADDFIIGFEHEHDAKRVMEVLDKRMARYGLSLHPDKTQLIDFRRPPSNRRGGKGPGSFDFLGFTIYWKQNARGQGWHMSWKTRKARLGRFIKAVNDRCRSQRHRSVEDQHKSLVRQIRGNFNYYGINDNTRSLQMVLKEAERTWFKWLNRRSQRSQLTWKRFKVLLQRYPLPSPQVYKNLWVTP